MAVFPIGDDDEEKADKIRQFFSPSQIDQQIRQAVHFCWMSLPKDRRSAEEVEKQVRRIVDRALRDFREDYQQFFGEGSP